MPPGIPKSTSAALPSVSLFNSSYCGSETWAMAAGKLKAWAQDYLLQTFGSYFITSINPKLVSTDSLGDSLFYNIRFKYTVKSEEATLDCTFLISKEEPGKVTIFSYYAHQGKGERNKVSELPLTDLSSFSSEEAAYLWMKANTNFYKWDKFIAKVKS